MEHISWSERWSGEFGSVANLKFMSDATQMAMRNLDSQGFSTLRGWLNHYPQIREIYVSIFSKQFVEKANLI